VPRETSASKAAAGEDRRRKIIDIAANLFLENSYERATMRSIGSAVGIDPATIYYYFPGKEAILVEILETGVEDLSAALKAALDEHDEPHARFRAAVRAHVIQAIDRPYQALYDMCFAYLPKEARKNVSAKRHLVDTVWQQVLEAGVADGVLDIGNVSLARLHLITAINGIYRWFQKSGPLGVDEVADSLAALFEFSAGASPDRSAT
jgi:AcrR family transcriptional regulator